MDANGRVKVELADGVRMEVETDANGSLEVEVVDAVGMMVVATDADELTLVLLFFLPPLLVKPNEVAVMFADDDVVLEKLSSGMN